MTETPETPSGEPRGFFDRHLRPYLPTRPWQLAVVAVFGLFAAGVIAVALVALALTPTLPSMDELAEKRLKVPMRVYTTEGDLIAEFGEEKRIPQKIDEVPDTMIKAILAAEDHSFFYHHGVDYIGIARAAVANLRTRSASQGASTITMQVARNYFLSPEKTLARKIREILLAYKIERELSKKEILELYVNKIFLGHRAYGFAAAAQIYYGKPLADLGLPEMAMLAGLPKAPSRDNPLTNPQSALERRNYVLRHMHSLGYINETRLAEALERPESASKHALRFDVEAPHVAEMVRQYMIERYDEKTYANGFHVYTTLSSRHQRAANVALRRGVVEYERRHGYRGPAGHVSPRILNDRDRLEEAFKDYRSIGHLIPGVVLKVEDKSATVYTQDGERVTLPWRGIYWARRYVDENTLGPALASASEVLHTGDIIYLEHVEVENPDEKSEDKTISYWQLAHVPQVSAALVSLSPHDGAILALAGGFDFFQSSFNRVMQAERQPGSSLKPFVYTAAFDKGFTAATAISGAPIVIEGQTPEDEWRPEDYSKRFVGPTRLRKALALSLNLVSVRLLRATGAGYATEFMERFGFDPKKLPRELSLVLGTNSATPMQMASAYAVYASGGHRLEPYFISRIEDAEHNVLERANPAIVCDDCDRKKPAPRPVKDAKSPEPEPRYAERVLSPQLAFLTTSILRDVIRYGTGQSAGVLGRKDLAGKTGTTNDYRDAWFSGYNADLVTTSWIGFDQPATMGRAETGGRAALPMWIDYMRVALEDLPEKPLAIPEGIVKARVNMETGLPTDESDPQSLEEFFIEGTETRTQGPVEGEAATTEPIKGGGTPTPAPTPAPENVRDKLF
jgi:penicillin-binding protein 1A